MSGAINHRVRIGAADDSAVGRFAASCNSMAPASAIPTHIAAQVAARPAPGRLLRSPEAVHSSKRLRVNTMRSKVREIASRLASA